jgi:PAS domain-containing protein
VRELERLDRQRRRALEELKIRDERFMAIVESSPLAIVCTDLENAVTLWNSAAERMFGWSAEEVLYPDKGDGYKYITYFSVLHSR